MKIIKIFLASSIEDLKFDRKEIGDFVRQLNDIYINNGIYFKLIKCDDYDDSIALDGKQSQYDEEIKNSDLCFFLFYTKVGVYTKHEFQVAFDNFKNNTKPKIITYFKMTDGIDDVTNDVLQFMGYLDDEIKHYYNTYSSIDTLKLGLVMQIKMMKLDTDACTISNGEVLLNGEKIAECANIPMFINHDKLNKYKDELILITKKYRQLYDEFSENPDNKVGNELRNVAKEKEELEKTISELEKTILETIEKMMKTISNGSLSQRQKEGYRYLEKGDYNGALSVLDKEEILADVENTKKMINQTKKIQNQLISKIENHVCELQQRIEALKYNGISSEIIEEIIEIYEKIFDIVIEFNLDTHTIYDYACFLYISKYYARGIEVAETLKNRIEEQVKDSELEILQYLCVLNLLGSLYINTKSNDKAKKVLIKAISIGEKQIKNNPEIFELELANSYKNMSSLYFALGKKNKGLKMIDKTLKLRAKYIEKDYEGFFNNGVMDEGTVIVLNDSAGNKIEFELADLIICEGKEYIVLLPVDDNDDLGEVVILQVKVEGKEESYVSVDDEDMSNTIFEIFKQKNKFRFEFVD